MLRNKKTMICLALCLSVSMTACSHLLAQENDEVPEEESAQILGDLFEEADYVFVGNIVTCKALGPNSPNAKLAVWFYRLTVTPGKNILGDLVADAKKVKKDAGQKWSDDWSFKSIHTTDDAAFTTDTKTKYLLFVRQVKASTMVGSIPLSICGVRAASETEIELAKQLAAEKNKK